MFKDILLLDVGDVYGVHQLQAPLATVQPMGTAEAKKTRVDLEAEAHPSLSCVRGLHMIGQRSSDQSAFSSS